MFLYFFANFELSIRRISSKVVGFSLLHHDDGQSSIRDIHTVCISIFSANLKLKICSDSLVVVGSVADDNELSASYFLWMCNHCELNVLVL
jgi:hypothetical protein